jgi:hypothetical protein
MDSSLSQLNPIHSIPYFWKIRCDIILRFIPSGVCPLFFLNRICVQTFGLPYAFHTSTAHLILSVIYVNVKLNFMGAMKS